MFRQRCSHVLGHIEAIIAFIERREDVRHQNGIDERYRLVWDFYGPREVVGEIRVGTARPKSRVDVDTPDASHLFLTEIKFGHVLTECSHVPLSSTVRGHDSSSDSIVIL